MAENFKAAQPKGSTGKRLTILSIDGGGVRGIIPAVQLTELEKNSRNWMDQTAEWWTTLIWLQGPALEVLSHPWSQSPIQTNPHGPVSVPRNSLKSTSTMLPQSSHHPQGPLASCGRPLSRCLDPSIQEKGWKVCLKSCWVMILCRFLSPLL
jgi:hypothetical protein